MGFPFWDLLGTDQSFPKDYGDKVLLTSGGLFTQFITTPLLYLARSSREPGCEAAIVGMEWC